MVPKAVGIMGKKKKQNTKLSTKQEIVTATFCEQVIWIRENIHETADFTLYKSHAIIKSLTFS